MNAQRIGAGLMALGLLFVLAGLLAWKGGLSWVGRLPGDFRFEGHGFRIFVPITSMLIVSVIVTLVLNLLRRLF